MSFPTDLKDLMRAARRFAENHLVPSQPFELDMASGILRLGATAHPAQVAGTYSGDGLFVWGWAHPSVPDAMRRAGQAMQRYARAHQMTDLLDRKTPATPIKARDYAAATALVSGADALFAGDYGDGTVFVCTYKEPLT